MTDSSRQVVCQNRLVFLDLETTGLRRGSLSGDEVWDLVLEVGMLDVDAESLEVLAELSIPVRHRLLEAVRPELDPFVEQMHTETGLWRRIERDGVAPEVAWHQARTWLRWRGYGVEATEERPLAKAAGSGLDRFDRQFLQHFAREVDDHFHYRSLDVSAVVHALRDAGSSVTVPRTYDDLTQHVALDDCRADVRSWAQVRDWVRSAESLREQRELLS